MLIRSYLPTDEKQVLEIVKPQISTAFFWPDDQLRGELVISRTQVLEIPGQIAAFVCLRDAVDAWEISVLGTHPNHQKQGHMEKLLRQVIQQFGSQRQLWLEVHEKNLKACNLYEKLGFKRQGARGGYYKDGSAALLYTRFP